MPDLGHTSVVAGGCSGAFCVNGGSASVNVERLQALAAHWRQEAGMYRRRGLKPQARMVESLAAELERELHAWLTEPLTLTEASAESGYSYDHLQHAAADGSIPNAGGEGAPRIRRCDLPRKPRQTEPCLTDGDLADRVLARRLGA